MQTNEAGGGNYGWVMSVSFMSDDYSDVISINDFLIRLFSIFWSCVLYLSDAMLWSWYQKIQITARWSLLRKHSDIMFYQQKKSLIQKFRTWLKTWGKCFSLASIYNLELTVTRDQLLCGYGPRSIGILRSFLAIHCSVLQPLLSKVISLVCYF